MRSDNFHQVIARHHTVYYSKQANIFIIKVNTRSWARKYGRGHEYYCMLAFDSTVKFTCNSYTLFVIH